jgi:hypothetical protein
MKYLILFLALSCTAAAQYHSQAALEATLSGDADSVKICDLLAGVVITQVIAYSDTTLANLQTADVRLSGRSVSLLAITWDPEDHAWGEAIVARPDKPTGLVSDHVMLHWVSTGTPVTGRIKIIVTFELAY